LFLVLGTLIAITVAAIILVILWYRLKTIFKRQQKRKKILEQQRRLNLSSSNNNNLQPSTTQRYASSDMLTSVPSVQLAGNQGQSQALIASTTPSTLVYKNVDALANDSIQILKATDDTSSQQVKLNDQRTTDIQATTPC
jgi:Flp pilus assembly protein TadB